MLTILTIGHSMRSIEEFIELLSISGIEALADIRRLMGSRKFPQFDQDALRDSLHTAGIEYLPIPELGGRRRVNADSHNTVWQNASFRAYADHMETDEFKLGIEKLLKLACEKRTAIMCAEAVWWRCHRALVSDYLKAKGIRVVHILSGTSTKEHPYTSAANVHGDTVSYTVT
ncbi:MAG: DUF488 family protein [Pyrinomonadaceae bacterium]